MCEHDVYVHVFSRPFVVVVVGFEGEIGVQVALYFFVTHTLTFQRVL